MRINHNIASLNTYRQLSSNSANGQKSLEKLSSGLRINRAGDDAAGLAISEKMRGQIRGLEQASRNAQDSISMIQTAEGALNETQSILQRMRELSVQSSNDTATDVDRSAIQKEITQLKSEIDRISNDTEFNQKKLLNGSLATGTTAQGAKAHSVAMDRGAVASKSGNVDGQNAIYQATVAADPGVKGAVEAGTAFSTSNGGAKIITGMNDEVKITVGDNSSVIKMTGDTAANGGKAYNIDEAITELNSKVAADSTLAGKVTFAKNDAGTKIVLNAVNTGDSVSIGEGTAGQSALGALGFDKTISATTGAATFTDGAATNGSIAQFSITIGGVTKSFDLTSATDNGGTGLATVGATDTAANLNTALNQHVNQAFFGDKAAGKIVFSGASAAARTVTFDASIADDITNIQIFDKDSTQTGAATLFGALTNTQTTNTNSVTYGKAATSAATIGTVIVKDSNDKFNLTVDTGSAETITLTAKTYSSRSELVDEINNQIQANANLKDKVTATLDTDNTLKFVSASTGTTSEVKVEAPSTAAQSALSALGFKGNVQTSITGGTFDGNFATASDAKFKMTVGALTKDIDFSTGSGISSNTSITAARDAIQTAVNDAFGENVVKVDINDGKLRFTNMAATDSFAIKNDSIDTATDTMTGATKLLGYASSDGKITSTVDITGAKAGEEFVMSVGGSTKVVTVGAGANQTENIAALQTGLDNAWGTNVFKVAANGNGFDIESTLNNVDVSINADGGGHTGGAMYLTTTGTGVKFTRMANDSLTLDNTSTKGTAAETAGDLQETTKLVNLTDNDGLNLGLTSGNVITVSGTKEGVEFSSKLTVTDNTTVKELMTAMQAVPELAAGSIKLNEQSGQLEFEGASGAANNIKNLKLTAQKSATDNTGVNTFNNKAGNFIQTQEAQDTRTGNEVQFQIGANQSQVTNLGINDMSAKALGVDKIDVSSAAGAGAAITLVDNALASVSNERAKLGAVQNRLEHTINNLATSTENLTASESRIRDVDMAKEMMEFTKNNILSQAAQAMMAQANQQPQGVLQLLR